MIKLTSRKGFNFFRSYYDVYNELSDKDKIKFMDALFDRQFQGVKPDSLEGMAKFAYISQTNSIDSQVKGYEDKLISLNKDVPNYDPWQGVNEKVLTPTLQVQEEGKGKVQDKEQDVLSFKDRKTAFIDWFNQSKLKYKNKLGKTKVLTNTDDNNLKRLFENYDFKDFDAAIKNLYKSKWAEENNMQTISHFIRIENFNKYLEQGNDLSQHQSALNYPVN